MRQGNNNQSAQDDSAHCSFAAQSLRPLRAYPPLKHRQRQGWKTVQESRRSRTELRRHWYDPFRRGKGVCDIGLASLFPVHQGPDRQFLAAFSERTEIKPFCDGVQLVVDRTECHLVAAPRQGGAEVRPFIVRFLKLDLERTIAGARGVELLGVVSRRLVKSMLVGLNNSRAKTVREVGAVGDFDQVARSEEHTSELQSHSD